MTQRRQLSQQPRQQAQAPAHEASLKQRQHEQTQKKTKSEKKQKRHAAHAGHFDYQGHDQVIEESSDEEDESIKPVFHKKPVPMRAGLVSDALAILSVKKNKDLNHIQGLEAVPRNSFRDLFQPEVSKVRRLSKGAPDVDNVSKRIVKLSSQYIAKSQNQDVGAVEESESSKDSHTSVSEEDIDGRDRELRTLEIHKSAKDKKSPGPSTNTN